MQDSFQDSRVMVTGASRGIGRAVAHAFAARGARVSLIYRRDENAAREAISTMSGGRHCLVRADLSVASEAIGAVETSIDKLGGLDIVVNNAGIFMAHPIVETGYADWQRAWRKTLDTNLIGPANVSYAAAGYMIEQGRGKIVNVSSRGAFRGEPDAPAYGASKAGVNAMSQSLAIALAPHGIFVGVVAPGFVETDMATESLRGAQGDAIRGQSPLGRVAEPEEIANVVLFLASDDIEFATGAIIDVNGASYLRS